MVNSSRDPQRKARWLLVAVVVLSLMLPLSAAASPTDATSAVSIVVWKQNCPQYADLSVIPDGVDRYVICSIGDLMRSKKSFVLWKQNCQAWADIDYITEEKSINVTCSIGDTPQ
jgi:hypothetical protein